MRWMLKWTATLQPISRYDFWLDVLASPSLLARAHVVNLVLHVEIVIAA